MSNMPMARKSSPKCPRFEGNIRVSERFRKMKPYKIIPVELPKKTPTPRRRRTRSRKRKVSRKREVTGAFWPQVRERIWQKAQELYQMRAAQHLGQDFTGVMAERSELLELGLFEEAKRIVLREIQLEAKPK